MTRVLVCGGREFGNRPFFFDFMDRLNGERKVSVIIHGCASGADHEAEVWATVRRIGRHRFPAQWEKHGKAAGPIRNQAMIDKGRPDLVVAFPGGRGTEDMVSRARAAGVKVIEVTEP